MIENGKHDVNLISQWLYPTEGDVIDTKLTLKILELLIKEKLGKFRCNSWQ